MPAFLLLLVWLQGMRPLKKNNVAMPVTREIALPIWLSNATLANRGPSPGQPSPRRTPRHIAKMARNGVQRHRRILPCSRREGPRSSFEHCSSPNAANWKPHGTPKLATKRTNIFDKRDKPKSGTDTCGNLVGCGNLVDEQARSQQMHFNAIILSECMLPRHGNGAEN